MLGFPYIFRGALDVRASTINEPMKIAAAEALAALAREDVPDKVAAAYQGGGYAMVPITSSRRHSIRASLRVSRPLWRGPRWTAASRASRSRIWTAYHARLEARLDPAASFLHSIFAQVRQSPKRVVFAEGEEHRVVRAANAFYNSGLGTPVLVGREDQIKAAFRASGITHRDVIEMQNARLSHQNRAYAEFLYDRLQRNGYLFRDCQRLVNTDRNVFAACMVACGHADAMVTGTTRNWSTAFADISQRLIPSPDAR